jgi:cytochrome c553
MAGIDRRSFLRSVGAASLAPASALPAAALAQSAATPEGVSGRNSGARLMGPVAGRLDDADIAAVSAYLAHPEQGSGH